VKKWLVALLAGLALGLCALQAQAGDPRLEWYTLETPHFRVTFHGGLEPLAQRVGAIAERVYVTLGKSMDQQPTQLVEILLTDESDFANGSATGVPYDAVRLFATAPDDMSALAEYDDWLNELVTHEFTHILHVDNFSGVPALINKLLGKTVVQNQQQPRWILEGLAVAMETSHTTGGRLRSSQWDMYLRADVLEHNLHGLDQMSGQPRVWPGGNIWYLYGSSFISFIRDTYGPNVFGAVADDYGAQVIPWGINRSVRRVTGRTYEELHEAWVKSLEQRYGAQAAAISQRGLREGKRLTWRGQGASGARLTGGCSTLGKPSLIYERDDGHTPGGFYEVALDGSSAAGKLRARAGGTQLGILPDCSFLFDHVAVSERRYTFQDLFRQLPGTSSREEDETRQRLTHGARARHPDVSPDGRRVVYVTNDRSTSTLRIADLTSSFELENERRLVPSAHFEQAYTPRFSPDGRYVAYSAWTHGGFRDIRVVDVATGEFRELFHDRALDQQPTFSPDGKRLYFVSDRTGVANIYAYELESGRLRQVTNVITGAYFPALSADEKKLVYTGYTSTGWDLFVMDNDPARWLEPEPYVDQRGAGPLVPLRRFPVERYHALRTLRPHRYFVEYGQGAFGNQLLITTDGADIAGLHSFTAAITVPLVDYRTDPQLSLAYTYWGLPYYFQLSGFRSTTPRFDYRYSDENPPIVEKLSGVSTAIGITSSSDYDYQSLALSYTVAEFSQELPLTPTPDPYALLPRIPHSGMLGLIHLGYVYSNVESTSYSISNERGFTFNIGTDYADEATASETSLISVSANLRGYTALPWARHHALAAAISGGTGTGTYPRRGLFSLGGFADTSVIESFRSNLQQSGFKLRGYLPGQFVGNDYNLLNVEYRAPLWYADRGISTLPAYLRTITATAFFDYGAAYNELDLNDPFSVFHAGIGAELWFELIFGYYSYGNLRLGLAKGLDSEAPAGIQKYLVVSSAF
jgi:hypothetical protein